MEVYESSRNLNVNGAYTVPRLEILNQKSDWPVVKTNWSHRKDLDLPCLDSSLVTVLIGQDLDVHDAIEVRRPSFDKSDQQLSERCSDGPWLVMFLNHLLLKRLELMLCVEST